jgi:surfeit locus 1 family protein
MAAHEQAAVRPRTIGRVILAILGLFLIVLFAGLGTWQVYRLQWKLSLIERVETRVRATPVAPPPAARWGTVTKESDEYRHVRLAGYYLYEYTTPVQAVSDLGAGFWLLTPLCSTDGAIILVNRGFIPLASGIAERFPARRANGNPCADATRRAHTLSGLLRISEPGGGFLRDNDPVRNRWFSRDVAAIAAARGLPTAAPMLAPFFVDAARGQEPAGAPAVADTPAPVGGLTVISFQNNHLVYALTWYALALMVVGAWWFVARSGANKVAAKARNNGSKA